jgi:hypothetical protein
MADQSPQCKSGKYMTVLRPISCRAVNTGRL